jgi:predicted ATPase/DNA-binding SARP family transcriptional activator
VTYLESLSVRTDETKMKPREQMRFSPAVSPLLAIEFSKIPAGKEGDVVTDARRLQLTIRLLGGLEVLVNGEPFPRSAPAKVRLLLAMLALEPGEQIRRPLAAGRLWPTTDGQRAGLYLNRTVWQLRKALGPEAHRLPTARALERALWMDWTDAIVDVHAFDTAIEGDTCETLQQAVTLYRGPVLAGYSEGAAEDDSWIQQARERRLRAYQNALRALAAEAQTLGEHDTAILYLRQSAHADPLWEPSQRALMDALAKHGDPNAAMEQYRDLRDGLRKRRQREPEPETTALFRAILSSTKSADNASSATTKPEPSSARLDNIPCSLTDLLGREEEVNRIETSLRVQRLVTLVGAGGVGKTRLAMEVAARLKDEFAQGAVFVELAALTDKGLVTHTVASALGLQEQPGTEIVLTVREFLRQKSLLLILDNCEHVRQTCAHLARALLEASPGLRILATSRQVLGLFGETVRHVPSLATPDPSALPPDRLLLDAVRSYPAIQVFAQRAAATGYGFELTAMNGRNVARICYRLDGIPLAIELAAVHCGPMAIEDLTARLESLFKTLTHGDTTALPRHQTLRALIDWSFQLLSAPERILLCWLSVFRGGWTLAAAESVCAGEQMESSVFLDLHTSLARQSLVFSVPADEGAARYRMLETVREFCHERLLAMGAEGKVYERHGAAFLKFVEETAPKLRGADQRRSLQMLERDHDNLRTALNWALEHGHVEVGLRLAGAFWHFWSVRGYLNEGYGWLQRALRMDDKADPRLRLKALNGAGSIAHRQDNKPAARLHFEEHLCLSEALDDKEGIAGSLASLANVAQNEADWERAHDLFHRALEIFRTLQHTRGAALTLGNLANLAGRQNDYTAAVTYHEESIAILREIGDIQHISLALTNHADTRICKGDLDAAGPLLAESIVLAETLKSPRGIAHCLSNFASLAVKQGQMERASVLIGAGEVLCERHQLLLPEVALQDRDRDRETVLIAIGEHSFRAAWTRGFAMPTDEAISYARKLES